MAWNRCGFPTPPEDDGEDHRKCPVCGWIPCLPNCRLGLTIWDVENGLAELQDMDGPPAGDAPPDGGLGGFRGRDDERFDGPADEFEPPPPIDPESFLDDGDFE